MTRRAVFLDRDGVLIETNVVAGKPIAIAPGEMAVLTEGAETACQTLADAGFSLVMVTNQPDIATGRSSAEFVETTNAMLTTRLGLTAAFVCPHEERDGCDCRKPAPGLIRRAAVDFGLDLGRSFMVGDRWRDIEAGQRAGCTTVLIDRKYSEALTVAPDHIAVSLPEVARWILQHADGRD